MLDNERSSAMMDTRLANPHQELPQRSTWPSEYAPSRDLGPDEIDDSDLPPFPAEPYAYTSLWEAILAHL